MENEADSVPALEADTAAAATPAAQAAFAPPPVPAFDPRRRIRELLSIPDRDRSDAEWDELNELEIQTAPGNRTGNQPFQPYHAKPGNIPSKNRNKNKGPRKPGGKPFLGKPNPNKPRPA